MQSDSESERCVGDASDLCESDTGELGLREMVWAVSERRSVMWGGGGGV
jgi:hypothetical protein